MSNPIPGQPTGMDPTQASSNVEAAAYDISAALNKIHGEGGVGTNSVFYGEIDDFEIANVTDLINDLRTTALNSSDPNLKNIFDQIDSDFDTYKNGNNSNESGIDFFNSLNQNLDDIRALDTEAPNYDSNFAGSLSKLISNVKSEISESYSIHSVDSTEEGWKNSQLVYKTNMVNQLVDVQQSLQSGLDLHTSNLNTGIEGLFDLLTTGKVDGEDLDTGSVFNLSELVFSPDMGVNEALALQESLNFFTSDANIDLLIDELFNHLGLTQANFEKDFIDLIDDGDNFYGSSGSSIDTDTWQYVFTNPDGSSEILNGEDALYDHYSGILADNIDNMPWSIAEPLVLNAQVYFAVMQGQLSLNEDFVEQFLVPNMDESKVSTFSKTSDFLEYYTGEDSYATTTLTLIDSSEVEFPTALLTDMKAFYGVSTDDEAIIAMFKDHLTTNTPRLMNTEQLTLKDMLTGAEDISADSELHGLFKSISDQLIEPGIITFGMTVNGFSSVPDTKLEEGIVYDIIFNGGNSQFITRLEHLNDTTYDPELQKQYDEALGKLKQFVYSNDPTNSNDHRVPSLVRNQDEIATLTAQFNSATPPALDDVLLNSVLDSLDFAGDRTDAAEVKEFIDKKANIINDIQSQVSDLNDSSTNLYSSDEMLLKTLLDSPTFNFSSQQVSSSVFVAETSTAARINFNNHFGKSLPAPKADGTIPEDNSVVAPMIGTTVNSLLIAQIGNLVLEKGDAFINGQTAAGEEIPDASWVDENMAALETLFPEGQNATTLFDDLKTIMKQEIKSIMSGITEGIDFTNNESEISRLESEYDAAEIWEAGNGDGTALEWDADYSGTGSVKNALQDIYNNKDVNFTNVSDPSLENNLINHAGLNSTVEFLADTKADFETKIAQMDVGLADSNTLNAAAAELPSLSSLLNGVDTDGDGIADSFDDAAIKQSLEDIRDELNSLSNSGDYTVLQSQISGHIAMLDSGTANYASIASFVNASLSPRISSDRTAATNNYNTMLNQQTQDLGAGQTYQNIINTLIDPSQLALSDDHAAIDALTAQYVSNAGGDPGSVNRKDFLEEKLVESVGDLHAKVTEGLNDWDPDSLAASNDLVAEVKALVEVNSGIDELQEMVDNITDLTNTVTDALGDENTDKPLADQGIRRLIILMFFFSLLHPSDWEYNTDQADLSRYAV